MTSQVPAPVFAQASLSGLRFFTSEASGVKPWGLPGRRTQIAALAAAVVLSGSFVSASEKASAADAPSGPNLEFTSIFTQGEDRLYGLREQSENGRVANLQLGQSFLGWKIVALEPGTPPLLLVRRGEELWELPLREAVITERKDTPEQARLRSQFPVLYLLSKRVAAESAREAQVSQQAAGEVPSP
jgi:hypothetical protein